MKKIMMVLMLAGAAVGAQEQVFELGDVNITGDRLEQLPVTSQAIVTEPDIRALGAQTADAALRLVPGVYMLNPGKNSRHVNIRGFSESELKVLVDGIPANETFFRTIDLSQIPSAAISGIKVVKGIPSVLYGANSMGGVVNIITKKGGPEPSASAEVQASDNSTLHLSGSGGSQVSNINIFATAAYQTSDGYSVSDDFDPEDRNTGRNSSYHENGGLRENSDYDKRAITGKIGYDTEDTKLYLSADWHDNEMGIPTEYNRVWRFTEWTQWHLNLAGEHQAGPVKLSGRAFYFKHDDTLVDDAEATRAVGGKVWFDESVYDDYSAGGSARADWNMLENSVLRAQAGYQFEQSKQRELNTRAFDGAIPNPGWGDEAVYETETWELALENEWKWDSLLAVVGAGYDLYRPLRSTDVDPGDDIDSVNPQAGARWAVTEDIDVYAGAGRKTRFPHMKELYSSHAGGNPDLDPEYTDTVDAGTEISLPFKVPVAISAAAFNNDIRDMILSVNTPEGDTRYENIGHAVTRGLELGTTVVPVENLTLSLNYTLLDAVDEDKDRRLPYLPQHRINGEARWKIFKGTSLFTQFNYAEDAREYIFDKMTKTESTRELPDYFIWDAGIEQKIFERATLIARVENILDEDYDIGDGPMPGRAVWAGCRVDW